MDLVPLPLFWFSVSCDPQNFICLLVICTPASAESEPRSLIIYSSLNRLSSTFQLAALSSSFDPVSGQSGAKIKRAPCGSGAWRCNV